MRNPPHFSGNFWWANSDYLKNLPKITTENYAELNRGEFWILSNTDKVYSIEDNSTIDRYQNCVMDEKDFPSVFLPKSEVHQFDVYLFSSS